MGKATKYIDNLKFPPMLEKETILFLTKRSKNNDSVIAWKKSVQQDLISKGNLFKVIKPKQKHFKDDKKLYIKDDETWGNPIGCKDE